jgi:hypothetical protein
MKKTYDVTIEARVTKTIRVQADSEDEAQEIAHEIFDVNMDGLDERYIERTLDCKETIYP